MSNATRAGGNPISPISSPEDRARLRELAEAASHHRIPSGTRTSSVSVLREYHAAATPAVVLALLDALTQAEGGSIGKMITDELDAMRHARDAALAERDALRAAIERVEALHVSDGKTSPFISDGETSPFCDNCGFSVPCPTVTALAGDGRD